MDIVTLGAALNGSKKYTDNVVHGIAGGITYKGEVNYYSDLPSNPTLGDAYTVKYSGTTGSDLDGTEYVWAENGGVAQWVDFSKDSYTKTETDALLATKQATLSQTQLTAVNSGIDSTKVAQIETNKNDISNLTMNSYVVSSGDLNDITTNTYAMYTGDVSNRPSTDGTWYFVKTTVFDPTTMYQEAVAFNANESAYTRIKRSNTWQEWRLSNLTNNQYRAVNSGIDSTKVAQIATNASDISDIQTTIGDINTVLEEVL